MTENKYIPFAGRKPELKRLSRLLSKKSASLVVIRGRRRIGKSRLIEEFAKKYKFLQFEGIAPIDAGSAQQQRDNFSNQLSQYGMPKIQANDWSDLFWLLAQYDAVKNERVIILFDEISWMANGDPDFLGKLKIIWDQYLKKNPKLILVLCGSISSWIEENIISSTAFFGRISEKITLEELPLDDANQLLKNNGFKKSAYEKFSILSVTGGVPWYLENIDSKCNAEENIKQLCFEPDGLLVNEYDAIFHDLFGRRNEIYRKIVEILATGPKDYSAIAESIDYHSGGVLSHYLDDLIISGFISRSYTWTIKTGNASKLSVFRLKDNYLRFYLKYIAKNMQKIQLGSFSEMNLRNFSGWESIIGYQFENLVLNNTNLIFKELGIKPEDLVNAGPYFQRNTTKFKSCQIDYLIQTKQKTLYVCEIKYSSNNIGSKVVKDVNEKINKLALPRGYSCLPVLIHVSEVSNKIIEQDFFYKIINFTKWLK